MVVCYYKETHQLKCTYKNSTFYYEDVYVWGLKTKFITEGEFANIQLSSENAKGFFTYSVSFKW